jgi:hypothetical protein
MVDIYFYAYRQDLMKVNRRWTHHAPCPYCGEKAVMAYEMLFKPERSIVGTDYQCQACNYKWKEYASFVRPGLIVRTASDTPESKASTEKVLREIREHFLSKITAYYDERIANNALASSENLSDKTYLKGWTNALEEIYRYVGQRLLHASLAADLNEKMVDEFWSHYDQWGKYLQKEQKEHPSQYRRVKSIKFVPLVIQRDRAP